MTAPARVTLVTGGARRVGAAIVRACAARGDAVVIHSRGTTSAAVLLAHEITEAGGRAATVTGDLALPDVPGRVVDEAFAHFGQLDLLVNSAATFERAALFEMSPEQWDLAFAVNTRAPFFASQRAACLMREGGVIINISDHLANESIPEMAAHSASKAALNHITRTLARAFAPRIRVNAIAPGLVEAPDDWNDAQIAAFLKRVPLGRAGSPRDVAAAVCWLSDAPYITGVILPVDGGLAVSR